MIKWTKEEGRKERREVRRKEGKYKTLLWDCHIPTAVIQNTIQGCRLLWIYYFSFSFLHSPPLKNFIFSFSIPRTWEYCKRWSRALPSPVKGSNSTPWVSPRDPGHHTADIRAGATTSQKAQHVSLTGSLEKQRRLVTFLSYLHCRSLWIVSRLLSSSIWHKNKLIIPEAPCLGSPPAGQRLRETACVHCSWFTACQAGSEKPL